MVEEVKSLNPELNFLVFGDFGRLRQNHVEVVEPWTVEESSARISELAELFVAEKRGLEIGLPMPRIRVPKYLATAGTTSLTPGVTANVEMGLQRAGDCNNSNNVDAIDFSILKNTFGKQASDPGYDDRADFNGDHVVNAVDVSIQKTNYGTAGAPPISPGGP